MAVGAAYRFTGRRRASLRRAQLISARKRKGRGRKALIYGTAATGLLAGGLVARHHFSGSEFGVQTRDNVRWTDGKPGKRGVSLSAPTHISGNRRQRVPQLRVAGKKQVLTITYTHKKLVLGKPAIKTPSRSFGTVPQYNSASKRSWPVGHIKERARVA